MSIFRFCFSLYSPSSHLAHTHILFYIMLVDCYFFRWCLLLLLFFIINSIAITDNRRHNTFGFLSASYCCCCCCTVVLLLLPLQNWIVASRVSFKRMANQSNNNNKTVEIQQQELDKVEADDTQKTNIWSIIMSSDSQYMFVQLVA